MFWCTGRSSTAVMPRSTRWAMAASCASPAYVPWSAGGHARVAHREALDVHLVDDRVGVAVGAVAGVGPGERPVDDQALGYVASRVERAGQVREVRVVAEDLGSERHRTGRGPRVGIEQQLRGVAPDPPRGVERAQRAEAVGLARADAVDEAVPDPGVVVLHRHLRLATLVVEEAQDDPVGDARRHREVRALLGRCRAERRPPARADVQRGGLDRAHDEARSAASRVASPRV